MTETASACQRGCRDRTAARVLGRLPRCIYLGYPGVLANTQTANLVLLAVYGAAGDKAIHFIPPMVAFVLG